MVENLLNNPLMALTLAINGVIIFIELIRLIIVGIELIVLKINVKSNKFKKLVGNNIIKMIEKIYKRNKIFSKVRLVLMVMSTIVIFIISINLVYDAIHILSILLLSIFNSDAKISAYISLTLTLCIMAYLPQKSGLLIFKIVDGIFSKVFKRTRVNEFEKIMTFHNNVIITLSPKLWIYLISIFITVLNSLEKITNTQLVSIPIWVDIRLVVVESVLTMIVIDRFLKMLISEYKNIIKNKENLINSYEKIK
ncbi:hypothetical protein ACQPUY_00550 [Clostridium nigeriense]|uniref:hypothetical protein n=1 Tax=Clostridium nigeriense TaxID=1805470 RepID=UPI003D3316A1